MLKMEVRNGCYDWRSGIASNFSLESLAEEDKRVGAEAVGMVHHLHHDVIIGTVTTSMPARFSAAIVTVLLLVGVSVSAAITPAAVFLFKWSRSLLLPRGTKPSDWPRRYTRLDHLRHSHLAELLEARGH